MSVMVSQITSILFKAQIKVNIKAPRHWHRWPVNSPHKGRRDINSPDIKVYGANMGPTLGRQDPDGPHVVPMNFAIWNTFCITEL